MADRTIMNAKDAVSASLAECFVTIGDNRYNFMQANVTATTDYLFLLAEFEVFGSRSGANQYEQNSQAQYDYYKAGNSRVRIDKSIKPFAMKF